MKKYNLIILAGGEEEVWCKKYGYAKKAFLPLLGKPMLDWVIEAFHKSEYIANIVLVGSKELERLDSMRYVHKRLFAGSSLMINLILVVFYIKTVIYKFANNHNGYLISFCDAAFLNTDIINATLRNLSEYSPGVALHYVDKENIKKNGFPVEDRTYILADKKWYTGSNIYYVKKFRPLLRFLSDIALLRKYRKEPKKILKHIGCEDKDIPGIEQVLSEKLSTKVKIFVSPYAEMGVDVDKPADYEIAKARFLDTELKKSRYKV